MVTFTGPLLQFPARAAFVWYAGLICTGACLLKLPQSVAPGYEPLSWIDALFTATSASCVTGLAVRSTGNELSWFGQSVLLLLIQIGGIGIMTATTFIVLRFGGRESLHHKAVVSQTLGGARSDLRSTIWACSRWSSRARPSALYCWPREPVRRVLAAGFVGRLVSFDFRLLQRRLRAARFQPGRLS